MRQHTRWCTSHSFQVLRLEISAWRHSLHKKCKMNVSKKPVEEWVGSYQRRSASKYTAKASALLYKRGKKYLLKPRVPLPNRQRFQLLTNRENSVSHRPPIPPPRDPKVLLESIVLVRVAVFDPRMRGVVRPIRYLKLFQTPKQLGTSLRHSFPRPRLFRCPDEI
jgi:hypothetical protein